jgi:hypothetical protein
MALSDKDIARIQASVKSSLRSEFEPLRKLVDKHDILLLGVNGDDGVCSDVKIMKDFREQHQITEAKRAGFIAAISTAVTIIGLLGREVVKAIFGK